MNVNSPQEMGEDKLDQVEQTQLHDNASTFSFAYLE